LIFTIVDNVKCLAAVSKATERKNHMSNDNHQVSVTIIIIYVNFFI